MRKILFSCLLAICTIATFAQSQGRQVAAVRTNTPIKIDGEVNDDAWKNSPSVTSFTEWRPSFKNAESSQTKTDMYILYDDAGIYVGGICRETGRDSISTELVGRDVIGVNDFVGVMFDTYLDEINGFGFYVTALGEQYDAKYSLGNEDGSWNSVWQSATKINHNGWTFEMLIPYSAIRFSKEKIQTWGINFIRKRNKAGKQFVWNPIDPNKFGLLNQAGTFTNIENIKSPIRLSFSPYLATYIDHNANATSNKWKSSVNGGMDVKYGISKAFTLDMTLIPDFGQVQSDNLVLNLSPFEVKYNENRTFFNEGTELFNKGNLFYSRRIGGQPLHYYDFKAKLDPTEYVVKNPTETKLLNATKISGRTAGGLGIGIFNAITKPQYAVVQGKEEREIETNPLTNYSVIVFDQTLKNNSSVTLVNTNVMRSGNDYDANVTAALWDVYDKKIDWNFWGKLGSSQLSGYKAPGKTFGGYTYNLNIGKFKGPFNFSAYRNLVDNKYQQNDLGYFTNNNYIEYGFWTGYKITRPKSFYNNLFFNASGNFTQRFIPRAYQSLFVNANINGQLKNLWNVGIITNMRAQQNDFYEPRTAGKVFKNPSSWMKGFWFGTNRAKKYSAGVDLYWLTSSKYNASGLDLSLRNQYRFNDKLTISMNNLLGFSKNNAGYAFVSNDRDSIIFGLRNRHTVENIFNVKYNFNNKMGLTLRARHYWSKVAYRSFFKLLNDGELEPVASVNKSADNNVNYFNVDMVYTWQFAQGSFINIAFKSAANVFNQNVTDSYYQNLSNTVGTPQQNSFSVKIIYYLDYLTLKNKG